MNIGIFIRKIYVPEKEGEEEKDEPIFVPNWPVRKEQEAEKEKVTP